ncbi:MAG: hypothetical protein MJE66_08705 [Proteobacteria bacterium]|nr:hypothetical protein [Pseudomonadota bacterium]
MGWRTVFERAFRRSRSGVPLPGIRVVPMMCAWCGEWMIVADTPRPSRVSHGICHDCQERVVVDADWS